jgi:hypothetical protein
LTKEFCIDSIEIILLFRVKTTVTRVRKEFHKFRGSIVIKIFFFKIITIFSSEDLVSMVIIPSPLIRVTKCSVCLVYVLEDLCGVLVFVLIWMPFKGSFFCIPKIIHINIVYFFMSF